MKFLKIDNNKVYFIKDKSQPLNWTEIDQLEKNDLMKLLDFATEDDFEMDDFDENLIQHKAHQIIYKNLSEKFVTFLSNKNRFKDESDAVFNEALEKYR